MTRNLLGKLLFSGFLSLCFLLLNPVQTFSQSDLIVEGNVLGYEPNEIKPWAEGGFVFIIYEYPALVKITKIVKGKETSQYIIVLLKPLKIDYAEKNFGIDKITKLKLVGRTKYFRKPKDFIRKGLIMKNGKIEEGQTFRFVPNVDKKDLPLDKKLPVYVEIERQ